MRYSKAFVRARFESVAKTMGWHTQAYVAGKAQVGAVLLDHNAGYGGYRLAIMHNETGAEAFFRGRSERLSAREMVAYLDGMQDAADIDREAK